jgi:hypothetical protein
VFCPPSCLRDHVDAPGTLDMAMAARGSSTPVYQLLCQPRAPGPTPAHASAASVLYFTHSLCPVCVAKDRMGRGGIFRRAAVAHAKQVGRVRWRWGAGGLGG